MGVGVGVAWGEGELVELLGSIPPCALQKYEI